MASASLLTPVSVVSFFTKLRDPPSKKRLVIVRMGRIKVERLKRKVTPSL